ncbi:hypothetical protein MNSC_07970 [Minisyncoccus archaeophilus]
MDIFYYYDPILEKSPVKYYFITVNYEIEKISLSW